MVKYTKRRKFPWVYPGTKYCGLQGSMDLGKPNNKLDEACYQHDLAYSSYASKKNNKWHYISSTKADERFDKALVWSPYQAIPKIYAKSKKLMLPYSEPLPSNLGKKRILALPHPDDLLKKKRATAQEKISLTKVNSFRKMPYGKKRTGAYKKTFKRKRGKSRYATGMSKQVLQLKKKVKSIVKKTKHLGPFYPRQMKRTFGFTVFNVTGKKSYFTRTRMCGCLSLWSVNDFLAYKDSDGKYLHSGTTTALASDRYFKLTETLYEKMRNNGTNEVIVTLYDIQPRKGIMIGDITGGTALMATPHTPQTAADKYDEVPLIAMMKGLYDTQGEIDIDESGLNDTAHLMRINTAGTNYVKLLTVNPSLTIWDMQYFLKLFKIVKIQRKRLGVGENWTPKPLSATKRFSVHQVETSDLATDRGQKHEKYRVYCIEGQPLGVTEPADSILNFDFSTNAAQTYVHPNPPTLANGYIDVVCKKITKITDIGLDQFAHKVTNAINTVDITAPPNVMEEDEG